MAPNRSPQDITQWAGGCQQFRVPKQLCGGMGVPERSEQCKQKPPIPKSLPLCFPTAASSSARGKESRSALRGERGPNSPRPPTQPNPTHLLQSPHGTPAFLQLGCEGGGCGGAQILAGHGQKLGHAELLGHGAMMGGGGGVLAAGLRPERTGRAAGAEPGKRPEPTERPGAGGDGWGPGGPGPRLSTPLPAHRSRYTGEVLPLPARSLVPSLPPSWGRCRPSRPPPPRVG